jgi:site-specific DNA recombinase
MMRIAIYVRVSTAQQVHAQTIDQQVDRLQTYCQSQHWPWETAQIFRDDGYSGAVLQRPGLERLRHHAAHAAFDCILITSLDRLARNYIHQMLLLDEFTRAGCPVHFLDQPSVQNPQDQLLLQIRSAVAEYERSIIIDRLRRGRRYKYQQGILLPWTTTPFGYRTDPDHPRDPHGVHCDPVTAPVVENMFRMYLEPGATLASVAKWLADCHVPTPTGHQVWRTNSVRRILANPVYKGEIYAGQERSRPVQRRRSPLAAVGRRGRSEHRMPPEEWIFVTRISAIVSEELWNAVQAKLATNQSSGRGAIIRPTAISCAP